MRRICEMRGKRRGAALPITVISLAAVMGASALAIDLGMLFVARGEAQRAADAAAYAAASAYVDQELLGNLAKEAEARAVEYAGRNPVRNDSLAPAEVKVRVIEDSSKVRVVVRRDGVETWLGRVFGYESMPVAAAATVYVEDAWEVSCVKPFSPPDPLTGSSPGSDFKQGDRVVLKSYKKSGESKDGEPAYTWRMPEGRDGDCSFKDTGHGAGAYRANICRCNLNDIPKGTPHEVIKGIMRGPTEQAIQELVDQDPGAYWDEGAKRVAGSRFEHWKDSPRVVAVGAYDRSTADGTQVQFSRFIWVFLEQPEDKATQVTGRYIAPVRTLKLVQ